MLKYLGFLLATHCLPILAHANPPGLSFPPVSAFTCEAEGVSVKVEILHYRSSGYAGPARILSDGQALTGGWSWKPALDNTRLSGYHHLSVQANGVGEAAFSLRTLYSPWGNFSGGWLKSPGYEGAVECRVEKAAEPSRCVVAPQNDCRLSPKRLCCECNGGQLSCH